MRPGSRLRQIGWAVALSICAAFFVALTFRVNAVKSDVRLAEREIVALEREKRLLEIEFQTRANQQQLANYNRVEFGYKAPSADQYLESERQLAVLGLPRNPDTPDPIRVARAPEITEDGLFPEMVSPLTGQPAVAEPTENPEPEKANEGNARNQLNARRSLAERLSMDNALVRPVAEVSE